MNGGVERRLSRGDLLMQTYALYRTRFWAFFRMAFLPGVLAYLFSEAWWNWVRPFLLHLLYRLEHQSKPAPSVIPFEEFGKLLSPPWYTYFLNNRNALAFVEGAVYWFLSAFLFAAVATRVLAEEPNARPLADAYSLAREKIGKIFAASLLGWICFVVCRLTAGFAVWKIVERLHLGVISATALFVLPTVLICGLLSRLGLTIPWLIDHPADSFFSAIRNSVRKTENWEPFFMLFLIKSAIAGYALYWLANRGLDWLWQRGVLSDALGPWIDQLVFISVAAALETPLFIALSILYREKTITHEEALPAIVG